VPAVATEKIRGLVEQYGVDDPRTLAFFTVHSTLDVEHSEAERAMISELAPAADDEEAVIASTRAALDAWWGFLDAVNS
jgi:pyrroloquinoline quinone (PQQ) biosynthesis protein C